MSTTHDETPRPADGPTGDPGPSFTRDKIHDLDQLRLSSSDRYIAGVAGGLGRYFGIDPIVVRVVLAALCVFNGIGLLLYAVLWIFVPSDRTDRAIVHLNGSTRRPVLVIFAGIAAIGILDSVIGGFDSFGAHLAWPLALVVAGCACALAYLRPEHYRNPAKSAANAGTASTAVGVDPAAYAAPAPTSAPAAGGSAPTAPPYAPVQPPVPPRPRRTGMILFWPTLATIIAAFGVLGLVAVNHDIAPLWWPGTALAIIGGALVVGAFVGRPGGLIPLGIITIPAVIATTVLGSAGWHHQTVTYTPTTASAVQSSYTISNGQATLDLSGVTDPTNLAGRTITVSMTAGELDITLPNGVATQVDASLDVAGDIRVIGDNQGGFEPSVHETVGAGAFPPLHLILNGRVGVIRVDTN